tara:strand:+ start:5244 stop:8387 length:3144 start_codon:yes stop_codon:yes gene_type:complete
MSSCDNSNIRKNYIVQSSDTFDILSACTGFYTNNIYNCTGNTLTIHSNLLNTNNIVATTLSACTGIYTSNIYGCSPINVNDNLIILSGLTFSSITENSGLEQVLVRNNSTGLVEYRTVSSIISGATTTVTGFTYNDANILSIIRNDGLILNTTINNFTGLTINGILSANTFNGDGIGLFNIPISGVTNLQNTLTTKVENGLNVGGSNEIFSGKSGTTLIFRTISGGSNTTITQVGNVQRIDVSIPPDTNTFVTGGTFNDSTDTLSLIRNDGGNVNISGISNTFVTGGTYVSGTTSIDFSGNSGFSPFTVNVSELLDNTNSFVTGSTFTNNLLSLKRNNNLSDISTFINDFTGLTVNGSLSATTFYGDGSNLTGISTVDNYVTGGTFNDSTDTLTLDRQNGSFNITGITNTFLTGQTFNNSSYVLSSTRNDGNIINVNLSSLSADTYVVSGNADVSTSTLNFTNNSGGTFTVSNSSSLFSDNDINVTGGTYNPSNGCVTFITNSGTTFDVCGFLTGFTDTFLTASTLNGDIIELERNQSEPTLTVDLTPVLSGKTNLSLFNTYTGNTQTILNTKVENGINLGGGNEIFSGKSGTTLIFNTISGGSNTTITQVGNVQKIDVAVPSSENTFVTGGTYNTNTDIITFNNNSGDTFNVTGVTDTFVTGTTFTSNEGTLTRNDGSEIFKLSGGTNVTLSNPSSNQIKIDVTIPTDTNTFVTGGTYSDSTNIITLDRNDAVSLNITGLTNTYVTGGTVSISATDNTNSGTIGLFYKDSDGTPRTLPFEDTFTSGGTYNNGTKLITFDRNDGNNYNISLSSISTTNTYVTGFTYNDANTFTLERNEGESDLTATINSVTGFTVNGNLVVTGDTNVKGLTGTSALLSANTDTILTLIGSGSTNPIFKIEGSSGELFTVTDSLIGSLFAVNNISGLPIFEVFSDDRILMGTYLAPSLNTTVRTTANSGVTNIYSIPTSTYTGAFFDYTLVGNGGARSGNIMSIWSGTTAEFNEVTTNDIGSSTNGVTFNVLVSGSSAILAVSAVTGTYTIKTIVRSI